MGLEIRVPKGRLNSVVRRSTIQPSLRDSLGDACDPALKRRAILTLSLRDDYCESWFTAGICWRFGCSYRVVAAFGLDGGGDSSVGICADKTIYKPCGCVFDWVRRNTL